MRIRCAASARGPGWGGSGQAGLEALSRRWSRGSAAGGVQALQRTATGQCHRIGAIPTCEGTADHRERLDSTCRPTWDDGSGAGQVSDGSTQAIAGVAAGCRRAQPADPARRPDARGWRQDPAEAGHGPARRRTHEGNCRRRAAAVPGLAAVAHRREPVGGRSSQLNAKVPTLASGVSQLAAGANQLADWLCPGCRWDRARWPTAPRHSTPRFPPSLVAFEIGRRCGSGRPTVPTSSLLASRPQRMAPASSPTAWRQAEPGGAADRGRRRPAEGGGC